MNKSFMNIYKEILKQNIPRLLNLINLDPGSNMYGIADREFWGWKTKDFVNATMQGAVHSLAVAHKLGIYSNEKLLIKIMEAVISATNRIKSKKGGLQEAYPNEKSFCVTALVAFDILSAIDHLKDVLDENLKARYLSMVEPFIKFISSNDEVHAVISNHLATGAAAVLTWNKLSGDHNLRYRDFFIRIFENQSKEGWYKEYEAADPGYQTLCTYYLSAAFHITKDTELKDSLVNSATFLKYFIHPDGSIGGLYGSRNTELYYPGGIVALADLSDDFKYIAKAAETGYQEDTHILPSHVDAGNYIPCLNTYAYAALYYEKNKQLIEDYQIPEFLNSFSEKHFAETGIYIKSTSAYYAILNYKKGGTIKVFDKVSGKMDSEDGGILGTLKNGKKFSAQSYDPEIDLKNWSISPHLYLLNENYPNPWNFIIIRILSLTLFKNSRINNIFKKMVVKLLITGKKKIQGTITISYSFQNDKITINENITPPKNVKEFGHCGKFKAIHMASSGYYSKQLKFNQQSSKFIEYI